jgi:co-chaperonin GroES (HSP10)|tara:strand:+ start:996 stop:1256 length:261 start_codon:yes stop_codon:yes gene_type:complete
MKAVGKYMLIEPVKEKEVSTKGGLILGESHREDIRYREAKVKTIGTLVEGVVDGDTVYYDRHAGFDMEIDKVIYKVIKEFDVVVVL